MGNSAVRERHQLDDFGPTNVKASNCGSEVDLKISDVTSEGSSCSNLSDVEKGVNSLPTVFKWDGAGKTVYLSGSFDNWKTKIPLVKSRHNLYTIVELPEGTHEYKFFVDGQWLCDDKEEKVQNTFGTYNNTVTVKPSDFEVFEALGKDCIDSGHPDECAASGRRSPPGTYSQSIPSKSNKHKLAPPVLPSQLLQIVLNQEVPKHCDPALLPEPNQVMLNHLYALSIKDGVMILSATYRYRKKYITTVLYRPI